MNKCLDSLFCNRAEALTTSLAGDRKDWEKQTQGTEAREGRREELLVIPVDVETVIPVSVSQS